MFPLSSAYPIYYDCDFLAKVARHCVKGIANRWPMFQIDFHSTYFMWFWHVQAQLSRFNDTCKVVFVQVQIGFQLAETQAEIVSNTEENFLRKLVKMECRSVLMFRNINWKHIILLFIIFIEICESVSHSVMSSSLQLHGL